MFFFNKMMRLWLDRLFSLYPCILLFSLHNPKGLSAATWAKMSGEWCEKEALVYLKSKGYRYITKNWRYKQDEIDLIVQEQDTLVFVEVRGRSTHAGVSGFHSLTLRKKQALKRAQRAYCRKLLCKPLYTRWDCIEIELSIKNQQPHMHALRHFEGISI